MACDPGGGGGAKSEAKMGPASSETAPDVGVPPFSKPAVPGSSPGGGATYPSVSAGFPSGDPELIGHADNRVGEDDRGQSEASGGLAFLADEPDLYDESCPDTVRTPAQPVAGKRPRSDVAAILRFAARCDVAAVAAILDDARERGRRLGRSEAELDLHQRLSQMAIDNGFKSVDEIRSEDITHEPLEPCHVYRPRPPISSGRRWAFMAREDIPSQDDPSRTYLTRWRLLQTPWFGLYVHCIRLPDTDRHMHDHPWSFVSIVLRGGYVEQVPVTYRMRAASASAASEFTEHESVANIWRGWLSIARRRAEQLHRIVSLARTPTWTLILVGRRRREWGFHTEDGWVGQREYFASKIGGGEP